ncbi:Solute carrier family 25 member 47-B [Orchesella cincta]|uniref:Solute carrier family 25 member 47-B n=1 Tax=Orchesella cincta TaxID=48709 RepID=A0A1D2MK63_ORCCI|nr:Solute carrier family 25 member 47-B [Orchesella cincta]
MLLGFLLCGCVGGAAQLVVACPVDLVKVQLQSLIHKAEMKGPVDCIVKIVNAKGIFGLYKGLIPQAWRDIPSSGLYFAIYEFLKRQLSFGQEPTKFAQFMAGGIAGTLSWWSIIPLDVIKSRIQGESGEKSKYKGILHCGSVIVKTHGVKGLFHGFWPLSIRAFPLMVPRG